MGTAKETTKRVAKGVKKVIPRRAKIIVRNTLSELSGTREMRDFFNQYYGDYKLYEELLKDKSDVTEYHVDKIIRTVGKQLAELQIENEALKKRVSALEGRQK